MSLVWSSSIDNLDWAELAALYRAAPLGNKTPEGLRTAFTNSMFKCFVYQDGKLVGVGRALADGVDCSYICDVALLPSLQGLGLGKQIVAKLVSLSSGHKNLATLICMRSAYHNWSPSRETAVIALLTAVYMAVIVGYLFLSPSMRALYIQGDKEKWAGR
ncbi:GNAT family N-acetyltransferase [Undibacterium sp. CY22W]|uniref:GNAT family N-acetyltransferase n=2 Tax=Undibacterium curvum TaxID=2762294 RepID=A0ABR7A0I0_9BURK|nr:GNAT family N-acetyltransferase [Undibacterium curvum]